MKLLIFLFSVFNCTLIKSQNLNIQYNYSQVGKNIRLGYETSLIPNLYLEPGIKYIVWTGVSDNENYSYKDRFRPIDFFENIGLYTSIKYRIYNNEFISLKVIYNGAITNSHLITDGFIYTGAFAYDSLTKQYYNVVNKVFQVRPKTFAFENYIGGEMDFKLGHKLKGFAQFGLGYTFYRIQDDPDFLIFRKNTGEFSWFMGGLGLKYNIGKKD